MAEYRAMASLKTAEDFRRRLDSLGVALALDAEVRPDGPLAQPLAVEGRSVGNRFCILPMEGWDAGADKRALSARSDPITWGLHPGGIALPLRPGRISPAP